MRKPSLSLSKNECNAATLSRKPSARDVSSELKRADATLAAGVSLDDDMVVMIWSRRFIAGTRKWRWLVESPQENVSSAAAIKRRLDLTWIGDGLVVDVVAWSLLELALVLIFLPRLKLLDG